MVKGVGCDIIEISRIRNAIARHGQHFLDKTFTKHEQDHCLLRRDSVPSFAGRFAAKEAIVKALGTGIRSSISWLDIEIRNTEAGQPQVLLSDRVNVSFDHPKFLLSISHCREYATATALLL